MAQPYQAYQKMGVATSNQKQLIVMLFDGMQRFTSHALKAMAEDDVELAHENLHKTGKIILELMSTLREDKGGEIAQNLKRIYTYCYENIVIANLKKDAEMVKDVQKVLANVGEGFREVQKQSAPQQTNSVNRSIRITG